MIVRSGFSLIEALVALVVLGIGLTSLLALQSHLIQKTYQSIDRWKAGELLHTAYVMFAVQPHTEHIAKKEQKIQTIQVHSYSVEMQITPFNAIRALSLGDLKEDSFKDIYNNMLTLNDNRMVAQKLYTIMYAPQPDQESKDKRS